MDSGRSMIVVFYLLLILGFYDPAWAETLVDCAPKNEVCINRHSQDRQAIFEAENKKEYPITVLFYTHKLENMKSSAVLPYVVTLSSRQKRLLSTFQAINDQQPYSYRYKWYWHPGSLAPYYDKNYVYSLPYAPGTKYRIAQAFNGRFSHHEPQSRYAVDFLMPEGTPVHAARSGVVGSVESSFSEGGIEPYYRSKANFVHVIHEDGTQAAYLHLKKNGAAVKTGQFVQKGTVIGYSGNTGYSSRPHLHFHISRVEIAGDQLQSVSLPMKFKTKEHEQIVPAEGLTLTATSYRSQ